MSVTSGITEARLALISIINAEFTTENFTALNDKLDTSLGNGGTRIGVSPIRSRPDTRMQITMVHELFVQFYASYNLDVDPEQKVDPAKVEVYAERFLRAIKANSRVGDDKLWFFTVTEMNFPDDPTGNKSRFECTLTAFGNNVSLVETVG